MKTKLFLSAAAFAIALFIFTYNNSYSTEINCCCSSCECSSCQCAETCCKDLSCSGCDNNKCCNTPETMSCCNDESNHAGGVSTDSAMTVCVVTGESISKGKELTYNYLGKDYAFCCEDCVESFKNEPIKYIKEDLSCIVMDEPVKKNISASYKGTKYYFCCKMCIGEFNDDPEKYLKKYDSK